MLSPTVTTNRERLTVLLVVGASCLLSVFRYWQDPLLNNDGTLYVHIANELIRGNPGALAYFDLNVYPALIAIVGKLLSVNAILAGQILNTLLMGLTAHAFLRCYRLLFDDTKWLWFAGILFLCHEPLIDYRSYFIREFGMWAFSLYAIAEVRAWQLRPSLRSALLWPVFVGIASAFRPEAALFFLLGTVPLLTSAADLRERAKALLNLNAVAIAGAAVILPVALLGEVSLIETAIRRTAALQTRFNEAWSANVGLFTKHVLTHPYNGDTATISLVAALGILIPLKLFSAWSAYYWAPGLWACHKTGRPSWPRQAKVLLWIAIACVLAYLCVFTFSRWFMSTRYAMFGGLLLILPTAALLSRYLDTGLKARILVGTLVFASGADGLISTGRDKQYLVDTINWSRENLPDGANLVSNKAQLALQPLKRYPYYIQNEMEHHLQDHSLTDPVPMQLWRRADYLIVRLKRREADDRTALLATGRLEEIQTFRNEDGDLAIVFRVVHGTDANRAH